MRRSSPATKSLLTHRLSHKAGGSRGTVVGARKSRGHREGDGQQQTPRREIRDVDGVTVTVRFPSVTVTVVQGINLRMCQD